MNDLKPCPFCGNGASLEWMDGDELDLCWVECGKCGASTVFCGQPELAIEAWNTRAERTCKMEWDEDGEGDELYPVGHVTCSACGAWLYAVNTMRFCPKCGAKVVE